MSRILIGITLLILVSGCSSEDRNSKRDKAQLIYETEHCRYYCMSRNGHGNCKLVVCECDEGYSCDSSTSW